MSDTANPYQSPETVAAPLKPLVDQGAITETMLIHLKNTSPWLRFVGILGFIGAGITVLWGILFLALGSIMGQIWSSIPGIETFSEISGDLGAFSGILVGLLITGAAALIFFPSLYVYRFGVKIRSYLRQGREQDLELAFGNNKSFWKFVGILYIIYLAIIPVTIVIAVIIAAASAIS